MIFIYKTVNMLNNKIYIGKHTSNNYNDNYLGSGIKLRHAVNKYGAENFKREILEIVNETNWDEREIYWIKQHNSTDNNIGYNISTGGQCGFIQSHTDETKAKISKALKGQLKRDLFDTEEKYQHFLDKTSRSHRGKKRTTLTKLKLSIAHRGQIPWNKGIPMSDDSKAIQSKVKIGRLIWHERVMYEGEEYRARDLANKLNIGLKELTKIIKGI